MMRPLGVGLIGLGKHGMRYLEHIREDLPGLRVVAVCRQDAAAGRDLAEALGAAWHPEIEALVADPSVEAVISVVPPTCNLRIVAAVASARKPLLIEKPFASDLAAAERQLALLAGTGIPVLVAQTLRFNPVVLAVKRRLAEIGDLHGVMIAQSFEPSPLPWIDQPEVSGGGMILHTGIHMFDLLRFALGFEAERVSCFANRVQTRRTEDSFAVTLEGGRGGAAHGGKAVGGSRVLATVTGSRATQSRSGPIRIFGAKGQIIADHVRGEMALLRDRTASVEEIVGEPRTVVAVLQAFEGLVRDGGDSPVSAADGAKAVAIVDACYRSIAADGAPVAVSYLKAASSRATE
jgi:predicted dehydrogenase